MTWDPKQIVVSDAEVEAFARAWVEKEPSVALAAFLAARMPGAEQVSGANSIYRNGFNAALDAMAMGRT
jgi:hypothetical protein